MNDFSNVQGKCLNCQGAKLILKSNTKKSEMKRGIWKEMRNVNNRNAGKVEASRGVSHCTNVPATSRTLP